jgi:arsenate reductase
MVRRRVPIVCTGNSARSQMAEAMIDHHLGLAWEAHSAGTQPTGSVHPLALRALTEVGIAHQGRSKSLDEFAGQTFDLVVTVQDDAAENCPVWLGHGPRRHVGLPDPARAPGPDEDRMQAIRAVPRSIEDRLPPQLRADPGHGG